MTRMVMEAASENWKPVFYLLEAAGFETWLVNAPPATNCNGAARITRLG